MNKRDFISIGLRLIGIYLLIAVISAAIPFAREFPGLLKEDWKVILQVALVCAIYLLFTYALLVWADKIARFLLKQDKAMIVRKPVGVPITARAVFVLAIKVVGTVQVIKSIITIILIFGFSSARLSVARIITESLLIIFGIYLIFGAGHFVSFIFRGKKEKVKVE